MGRKKRLAKGIESLERQLKIHEEKFNLAADEYVQKYWKKEMDKFKEEIDRKKRQIDWKSGK